MMMVVISHKLALVVHSSQLPSARLVGQSYLCLQGLVALHAALVLVIEVVAYLVTEVVVSLVAEVVAGLMTEVVAGLMTEVVVGLMTEVVGLILEFRSSHR